MDRKHILAAFLFISAYSQATIDAGIQNHSFRRATLQETTWLYQQTALQAVSCAELWVASEIPAVTRYNVSPVLMTFSARPLFPQGRIICQVTMNKSAADTLDFYAREEGYLGTTRYELTHTGVNADGYIGDSENGWHFACETRENVDASESDFHGCFINENNLYIQKVPELTALDVPGGYLISVGKMRFNPISQLHIGNSEFITAADFPFIYGENAAKAIAKLENNARVSWTWGELTSGRVRTSTLSPSSVAIAGPAVEMLDRAWARYQ